MAVNKVEVNGETVLDLSQDSVTPEQLAQGVTAHNAAGEQIVGTYAAPVTSVNGQTGDVEVKAVLYEQQTLTNAQKQQARENIEAAPDKLLTTGTILLAANWTGDNAPYSYTLNVAGVTADSHQVFLPALDITAEQLEALQGANIQDGGQSAGTVTLKAFGTKPTIDLPIRIIKRGDA